MNECIFPTAVRQRGVKVKFLVNDHASRVELMKEQLSTLQAELFSNVEVRLFDVSIHSKVYMVLLVLLTIKFISKNPTQKYVM